MQLPSWLRGLFRRSAPMPAADRPGRNDSDELIRAEFKRRYLVEFAGYVGRDRAASAGAGANFLLLAAMLGGAALAGPVAGLVGTGVALANLGAARAAGPRFVKAGLSLGERLQQGEPEPHRLEAWLDRHMAHLPRYLDRLDREEADRRRARALIERINKGGRTDGVSAEERRFLATRGIRRLRTSIRLEPPLPPRMRLSNWHHAQLARALWFDLGKARR